MHLRNILPCSFLLAVLAALNSCAVKDDLPLPIKKAEITAFKVVGQCNELDTAPAEAVVDTINRKVEVFVSDTVNLGALRIDTFKVSNDATIIPIKDRCWYPDKFPTTSFTTTEEDVSSKFDFTKGPAKFILRTYQDYEWTIDIKQVIERKVKMSGQEDAIIDPFHKSVIVNVAFNTDLSTIKVDSFSLGGKHGIVSPDPTKSTTYDFSSRRTFYVTMAGSGETQKWTVMVYEAKDVEKVEPTAFARSVSATISGKIPYGTLPVVEYHAADTEEWTTLDQSLVIVNGTRFTADLTGIRPATTYTYRVTAGTAKSDELTFETVKEQQLENAGFEDWNIVNPNSNKALYQPWGEGQTPYWGTGNPGATIATSSNSTYKYEEGRGRFANLESKFILAKLAAGNIFTGEYIETDGTNGVLSFGRPYTSFPTKMRFEYKYKTSPITVTGGEWKEPWGQYIERSMYENLKGQPDSCCIYIALGDWEPVTYTAQNGVTYTCPYLIRTRSSALHLFDMNDSHLIAFAQMTKGEDVKSWTTETITLNYRIKNRQPKYIIVVASSTKYGDYFTGGKESLLQIDNLELLYE